MIYDIYIFIKIYNYFEILGLKLILFFENKLFIPVKILDEE